MTSVFKIGRTNYYSVRKGTQQYCVAEGKRLQDLEYCWQSVRDAETGKTFFVSGSGVRRWHLPDIHLTDRERQDEEKELRFRREQKALETARLAKQKAGDAALLDGGGRAADEVVDPVGDAEAEFAARDRAAMSATLQAGWETQEKRRPVTRFVKGVLQPYMTQGLLDEKTFSQLVTTISREHCAAKAPPFSKDQEAPLKDSAMSAAKQRVDEEKRRNEYEKLTEELKDKVRRLDAERRKMSEQIETMTAAEEKMKDELFGLRAHKQDTLLTGFKRLTRVGLINAYWERWVKHKAVTEAQLHIKARERRQSEMSERVAQLETQVHELQDVNAVLRNRVQQQQGRDVVATLLNTHGKNMLRRFYHKWRVFAENSAKDREYFKVRQMLADCPTCKLRGIEMERLYDRLRLAVETSNQHEQRESQAVEAAHRLSKALEESQSALALQAKQRENAETHANDYANDKKVLHAKVKALQSSVSSLNEALRRLQYETEQYHHGGPAMVRDNIVQTSAPMTRAPASNFFAAEAERSAETHLHRITSRPNAGVIPKHESQSGALSAATERAIAPNVFGRRPQNPLEHVENSKLVADGTNQRLDSLLSPKFVSKRTAKSLEEFSSSNRNARTRSTSADSSTSSSSDSSSSSSSSDSASSSSPPPSSTASSEEVRATIVAASTQPLPDRSNQRCPVCGFAVSVTPFCPKDGSRHQFQAFAKPQAPEAVTIGDHHGVTDILSVPSSSFATGLRPATRLAGGGGLMSLPPGRQFDEATQQWGAGGRTQAGGNEAPNYALRGGTDPNVPQTLPYTASLRASLSLDAKTYKPNVFFSQIGVPLGEIHTDARLTSREVAEYVRSTHLTAAANSNVSAATRNNQQLESYPSLSLDARVYSQPNPPLAKGASRWSSVFDTNDGLGGVLSDASITSASDAIFGVYRKDELGPAARAELNARTAPSQASRAVEEVRGTPNFVQQSHRLY